MTGGIFSGLLWERILTKPCHKCLFAVFPMRFPEGRNHFFGTSASVASNYTSLFLNPKYLHPGVAAFMIFSWTIFSLLLDQDFPSGSDGKTSAYNAGDLVQSLIREHLLEKEMATHSSVLAWKIPQMEEPWTTVHGVSKSWTRLSNFTFSFLDHTQPSDGLPGPKYIVRSFPSAESPPLISQPGNELLFPEPHHCLPPVFQQPDDFHFRKCPVRVVCVNDYF